MILRAKQLKDRLNKLKGDRSTWEYHWQEVADFVMPNKDEITREDSPGEKKTNLLFDNTAIVSNKLLSGALHSMLTNPNQQFFDMRTRDERLNDKDNVRAWFQHVTDVMHKVLNNSNFQPEVHEFYQDLGALGTGNMFAAEHPTEIIRFKTIPIQEYYIEESHTGMVDTVYREYKWDARQIIQRFGEKGMHDEVIKAFHRHDGQMFEIIHAVYPLHTTKRGKANVKYVSHSILYNQEHELEVKMLEDFPYLVSRWSKISGEKWGRSPGMDALPDIKTVNKMVETMIRGAQKTIDPPLSVPDDGFMWPIRVRPGSINVRRAGTQDKIEPIFNDARIDFGFPLIQSMQGKIREAFFIDQLKLREGPQMTATEVEQRAEESMRLMGPILGRQEIEFLRPMVDRLFGICSRRKMFDQMPPELSEVDYDIKYSGLIARAQKVNIGRNIERSLMAMSPFFNLSPSSADNINYDESVRIVGRTYGLPEQMFSNQDEMDQIREARAEQQQQQAQQEQMVQQADIISKTKGSGPEGQ